VTAGPLLAAGPVWNGGNSGRFGVDRQSRSVVAAGPMWYGSCSRFNVDSQIELAAAGPMWNGSGSCRAVDASLHNVQRCETVAEAGSLSIRKAN